MGNKDIQKYVKWRISRARDQAAKLKWRAQGLKDIGKSFEPNPSLALVVVGRNDNYGGDFRGRLDAMLSWNLQFPFQEAIYVEWNPIKDTPSDAPWLVEKFNNLRVYVVSSERHQRCCTNPRMPVMEYFAKNVAIRRATSDWILQANADVLIGPDVFKRLTSLRKDRVYGTHNVNINWSGGRVSPQELTENIKGGFPASPDLFSVVGNFVLAHRELWHRGRGYDEKLTDRRVSCDGHGVAQLYYLGAKPRVIGTHYHLDHPESCQNAILDHQGKYFDPWEGVPYQNPDDWGQADATEKLIGERTYYLE